MKRIAVLAMCLFSLALSAGCGPPAEVRVGMKDSRRLVKLAEGQKLLVELEGNPQSGVAWEVSEIDDRVLVQLGQAGFERKSGSAGGQGLETFTFQAVSAGKTELMMLHHELWTEGSKPDKTFRLSIEVR